MNVTSLVGVVIGGLGIWAAVQAIASGTVTFVFVRLFHRWGPTLSAEFDRENHPVGFWTSTLLYGAGGLVVLALSGRALLH